MCPFFYLAASLAVLLLSSGLGTHGQLTSYRDSDEDLMAEASSSTGVMSPIDMLT